ncbi:MAG: hypothetical protein ACJA13_001722 [Paraglaciecola sp.]|jgi:hypothetical protein
MDKWAQITTWPNPHRLIDVSALGNTVYKTGLAGQMIQRQRIHIYGTGQLESR